MEREIRALRQRVITAYQKFIYCIPSRKPVNELLSCNPSLYLCFFCPGGSDSKESACNAGDRD